MLLLRELRRASQKYDGEDRRQTQRSHKAFQRFWRGYASEEKGTTLMHAHKHKRMQRADSAGEARSAFHQCRAPASLHRLSCLLRARSCPSLAALLVLC